MFARSANSSWAISRFRRSARTTEPKAAATLGSNDVARLATLG